MPAAAIGGAVLGSAIIGSKSASKAGKAQAQAASQASDAQVKANRENIAFQKEMFNQQRKDNAPWRDIGEQSLKQLQSAMKSGKFDPGTFKFNFEADPGYQFRQQQGVNALDASAAARGRLQSGAQSKAVTAFGSDLASQEYGNAFNRAAGQYQMEAGRKSNNFNQLASLANVGQVANQADMAARQNMGQQVSNSTLQTGNAIAQGAINQGNARASAYQGQAQAIQGGIGNLLTLGMM